MLTQRFSLVVVFALSVMLTLVYGCAGSFNHERQLFKTTTLTCPK